MTVAGIATCGIQEEGNLSIVHNAKVSVKGYRQENDWVNDAIEGDNITIDHSEVDVYGYWEGIFSHGPVTIADSTVRSCGKQDGMVAANNTMYHKAADGVIISGDSDVYAAAGINGIDEWRLVVEPSKNHVMRIAVISNDEEMKELGGDYSQGPRR